MESTTLIGGDPRKIRIQVPDDANGAAMLPRVQDAFNNNATEFVVPDLNYGHRNGSTQIYGSSRVKFSNLQYYNVAHFWLTITQNDGPITLSNVDLEVSDPATELLASWRDGMHIKNGRWGILIEEGDWDGAAMYDDTFAIYTRRQVVVSTANDVATLTPSFQGPETFLWQAGDWASFWSSDQETLRGMARVVSAMNVDASNFAVTFESIPDGVLPNDIVLHEESLNRGTLVRNCRTTSIGTESSTTRLRGTDMRFENNTFEDFDFRLEWSDALGTPRARNVVVQDCYLSSVNGSLVLSRPLGVLFKDCQIDGLKADLNSGADDVYFDNVAWTNMTGDLLDLRSGSHAWLFGGSSRNGSSSGLSVHLSKDGSSSIEFAVPDGYPPVSPPASPGFSPPAAPMVTAVAGEGRVALDWSVSAGAISYAVYRSTTMSGPFLRVAPTLVSSHMDIGLTPGVTYHYGVTATDENGNESSFGNLVSSQPTGTQIETAADTYVNGGGSANGNFGSGAELLCKTDATNPAFSREPYLRFNLSALSGPVSSATMRLKVVSTTGSGDLHTARAVANDGWGESTLTWNNKPAAGSALGSAVAPEADEWIELDVTDQVVSELAGDQFFSTAVTSGGSELVRYHSRESGNLGDRPNLVVTMMAGSVPAAPTGLSAVADGAGKVTLSWDDQSGAGVLTYGIHRSTSPGGPYTLLMHTGSNSYVDNDADPSQIYFYVATAIEGSGNVSALGVEASTVLSTPLLITDLSPADDDVDASGSANLVATFNRAVQPGSGNVTLVNMTDGISSDIPVSDEAQITISGNTLFIDPSAPLLTSRAYAVRIEAGAIDGAFGNPFAGIGDDTTWNFTTSSPREPFDYFDEMQLSGGDSADGTGWLGGWEGISGGGLAVCNRRIDQNTAAGSTRELATPFSLNGSDDYYLGFFARTDAGGTFGIELKQTSPGPFVRWAVFRNANGSMTIQSGTVTSTSAPGVFAADKEYLVVSKFETDGDIGFVKLIDPANPGDYPAEPLAWDLSVSGLSGVTIDRVDVTVGAGSVLLDDLSISPVYADVIGGMASEVPVTLSPVDGAVSPYAFPNFGWTEHREQFREVGEPVNYEIQIASDAGFATIVDEDTVGLPRYVHDQPFAEGTYHWRVRSITDAGRVSAWSGVASFTIAPHDETVTVDHDALAADHGAEVLAAVAQTAVFAAQGKSVKLIFPAGDYHFADASMSTLIDLDGVRQVSIEGAGAHLHFTSRKQSLISSEGSEEVSIGGFKVSYATGALRIQGTVIAVDPGTSTATLAIEPGYPDFSESDSHTSDIFLLVDPSIDGRQKTGSASFYRLVANGYSQNPDSTWAVTLESAAGWEAGDRFVYHFRAGSPVMTRFNDSHAITLHGLEIGGWGNMMIASTHGSLVSILNVDTFLDEGKWMMGNADGVHLRGHEVGPWIEGTRIQANGDDGIALYARPASMSSAKPGGVPNAANFVDEHFNLEAGDEVAFFEPLIGTILLETRVSSVVDQGGGDWLVSFENDLPDGMNFSGNLVDITQVWNRSKSCGDFMIRNGRMINNRRYATVFRSQRGIVENMEYSGASSRSIVFVNGAQWPNGLYASEIIVRNNLVQDSGFVAGNATPLWFNFNGHLTGAQSIGPRNLLIESNTFVDCGTPEIVVNGTRKAVIRNNRTHTGDGVFVDAVHSASDSEKIVAYMDDLSGDSTPPAAPSGLVTSPSADAIFLDWKKRADLDAALCHVYRSTVSGGSYSLLAGNLLASEYRDNSASPGTTYYYVITASDVSGNESGFGDEDSAALLTDYDNWLDLWPDADLSNPENDYDGDGLNNDEERIWGLDPTRGSSVRVITQSLDPADGIFRYSRRVPAFSGLTYTVWTSSDLLEWTLDSAAVQRPVTTVDGVQEVEVTVTAESVDGRLFMRMQAAE